MLIPWVCHKGTTNYRRLGGCFFSKTPPWSPSLCPQLTPHAFLISFQTPSSKRQIIDNSLWTEIRWQPEFKQGGHMICGVSLISDTPPLSCLQAMAAYLNNLQTSHVEKKNRPFRTSHFLSCVLISGVLIVIIFAFKSARILIGPCRWGTILASGVEKIKAILRKPLFWLDPDTYWVVDDVSR